jgi:hypothetical protein
MKKPNVIGRYKRLKEGCENVQDDERCGRPRSQRTDENVEKAPSLVRSDNQPNLNKWKY